MNVDISPITNAVVILAGTALTVFGSIALNALSNHYKGLISAQQVAAINIQAANAITYGETQAESLIAAKGWDHPEVKNAVLATALTAIVKNAPDALAGVGLTPGSPEATAKITALLTRAYPAAMAVAAASPVTPDTPAQAADRAVAASYPKKS